MNEVGNILVTENKDLPSLPYTIQRVNVWGISDGTLSADNPCDNDQYTLIEQHNGVNVYRPKEQA